MRALIYVAALIVPLACGRSISASRMGDCASTASSPRAAGGPTPWQPATWAMWSSALVCLTVALADAARMRTRFTRCTAIGWQGLSLRSCLRRHRMSRSSRGAPSSAKSPALFGPYHLINAALNVEASKTVNRRGRNADFLCSVKFIGSKSTDYVETANAEDVAIGLDLATAMAVSGAAVSSNMGAQNIKPLTPSMALLNVRLGYWMRNPNKLTLAKPPGPHNSVDGSC